MRVPALTPQGGWQRLQFCRHRFKSLVMDDGVAHLEAKHAVVSSHIVLPDHFPLKVGRHWRSRNESSLCPCGRWDMSTESSATHWHSEWQL